LEGHSVHFLPLHRLYFHIASKIPHHLLMDTEGRAWILTLSLQAVTGSSG
jgi:hypothetical protein